MVTVRGSGDDSAPSASQLEVLLTEKKRSEAWRTACFSAEADETLLLQALQDCAADVSKAAEGGKVVKAVAFASLADLPLPPIQLRGSGGLRGLLRSPLRSSTGSTGLKIDVLVSVSDPVADAAKQEAEAASAASSSAVPMDMASRLMRYVREKVPHQISEAEEFMSNDPSENEISDILMHLVQQHGPETFTGNGNDFESRLMTYLQRVAPEMIPDAQSWLLTNPSEEEREAMMRTVTSTHGPM